MLRYPDGSTRFVAGDLVHVQICHEGQKRWYLALIICVDFNDISMLTAWGDATAEGWSLSMLCVAKRRISAIKDARTTVYDALRRCSWPWPCWPSRAPNKLAYNTAYSVLRAKYYYKSRIVETFWPHDTMFHASYSAARVLDIPQWQYILKIDDAGSKSRYFSDGSWRDK